MSRPLPHVIRAIALVEAAKGALALLAGAGLLLLVRHDAAAAIERFFRFVNLDPASHYPHIVTQAASGVSAEQLMVLALLAFFYAAVRGVEAWWLWHQRPWAEWFALGSTAFYLPVEIYELNRAPAWPLLVVFLINLAIVAYLGFALRRHGGWSNHALARG
jgi:uncharacterized membrane protein (DUF2068 family)